MFNEHVSFYDGSLSFADKIKSGSRIGIVGIGPGGVDSARYCAECLEPAKPVDLFSRNGRLSKVQTINSPDTSFDAKIEAIVLVLEASRPVRLQKVAALFAPVFKKADPLFDYKKVTRHRRNVLAALLDDIQAALANGPPYRHVLEAIGARAPRIWRCLSPESKELFRKRYLRLYYVFRHAMPIEAARWLARNLEDGTVRVSRLLKPIAITPEGLVAVIGRLPGGHTLRTYDHIVIATGPEWDLKKGGGKLIQQLLRDGLATADPMGGFTTSNFELSLSPGLFAMGGNVRGEDFAVHSLPALVRHAKGIETTIRQRIASNAE